MALSFSAGGFMWRFGKANEIDINPMLKTITQRRNKNKEVFGRKVTQYKLSGQRVAIFPTINDAAKATGIKNSEISLVMQKKGLSPAVFIGTKNTDLLRLIYLVMNMEKFLGRKIDNDLFANIRKMESLCKDLKV